MDKAIVEFISEHHLLTLATSKDNVAYCCNVFYVFNQENNSFIFSSLSIMILYIIKNIYIIFITVVSKLCVRVCLYCKILII
jgi:nitroimidazol reductase NimA-like FMN-containing flavoprotein (pyridoxamine 5'-phosphate oxidase superfamily)